MKRFEKVERGWGYWREAGVVDERLEMLVREFAGTYLALIDDPNDIQGHVANRSSVLLRVNG